MLLSVDPPCPRGGSRLAQTKKRSRERHPHFCCVEYRLFRCICPFLCQGPCPCQVSLTSAVRFLRYAPNITCVRSRSIPRRPIEASRTSVLREWRTFCVWHDDLITCEAGEAISTSRGSRLCSYAKISLYHVYAACSQKAPPP